MYWEISTTTEPIACKDYPCNACEWIDNSNICEQDVEPKEWASIQKARENGDMIKAGQKYLKVEGRWDGDWAVYRARPEIQTIVDRLGLIDV